MNGTRRRIKAGREYARIVRRDGQFRVVRRGGGAGAAGDVYHFLLQARWSVCLVLLACLFLAFNMVFATLYAMKPFAVSNLRPGVYLDAFFFSVETMATVGYGVMAPVTTYGHLLATAEIVSGMLFVALTTGLTFAKFTRTTSRVLFSNTAVLAVFEGAPTFMFRAANLRSNQIVEARVKLTLVQPEVTSEGYTFRRFVDLDLVRASSPIFALTWTIMHRLGASSPLVEWLHPDHDPGECELIAIITGIDETFSSTIHSRQSYLLEEVERDRVFADIIHHNTDGAIEVDYSRFHSTVEANVPLKISE